MSSCSKRTRHPRFHIGESLLPFNLPLLKRLGVDKADRRHRPAEVGRGFRLSLASAQRSLSNSAMPGIKACPRRSRFRRSEFDHILMRKAAANGARVLEGWRVIELDLEQADGAR